MLFILTYNSGKLKSSASGKRSQSCKCNCNRAGGYVKQSGAIWLVCLLRRHCSCGARDCDFIGLRGKQNLCPLVDTENAPVVILFVMLRCDWIKLLCKISVCRENTNFGIIFPEQIWAFSAHGQSLHWQIWPGSTPLVLDCCAVQMQDA